MEPRLRCSAEQFALLIEFMERHGDLAKPQLGAQGCLRSNERWQELATLLNSVGGGDIKSVDKWKKVWADWKTKTKIKHLDIRPHASGTGGSPSSRHCLTALERVVNAFGMSAVLGMPIPRECGFNTATPPVNHFDVEDHIIVQVPYSPALHLPASPPLPPPPTPPSSPLPLPSSSPLPQPPSSPLSPPLPSPPPPSSLLPPPSSFLPISAAQLPSQVRRRLRGRRQRSWSPRLSTSKPRRNRGLTPFERAAKTFAAVEERLLEVEKSRVDLEKSRHEFERERHADLKQMKDRRQAFEERRLAFEKRRLLFEEGREVINLEVINLLINSYGPR